MNDNLPRVIEFEDIREGMIIELTNPSLADWAVYDRVGSVDKEGDIYLPGHGWVFKERSQHYTYRVISEPPKPPLPTEGFIEAWGTPRFGKEEVHLVVATLDPDGDWYGLTEEGESDSLSPSQITRWHAVTVAPVDPTAPKTEPVTVLEVTEDDFAAITCDKRCPGRGYTCTRPEGHDGLHIAAITGHGVYAYWGDPINPASTLPSADDGLRERVEALADGFESIPEAKSTGRYVAHHLRAALTETSAPKTDDGLRERVEKLADLWENDFGPAPLFARELRAALNKTSADT